MSVPTVSKFWDFHVKPQYGTEILAGFTVAMTMIPESLSFAILAGLPPLMGLYAAFIMGLITSIFGGRPGMISGGAGATIIVMLSLIKLHGIPYLLGAVIFAGILQILFGIFNLTKFIKLIPKSVMYGFVNGLAVFIFISQLDQFKLANQWLEGPALWSMIGLVALTMLIVYLVPKFSKAVPASLLAIIVLFAIVYGFDIPTKTIADIGAISGAFPSFAIPDLPLTLDALKIIAPYGALMAGVGMLESMLTMTLVDDLSKVKGNRNREAIAQGAANMTNGFFGGMGGCAMIAQTFVNLNSGGKTRFSAIVSALVILAIILVAAPIIEQVPIAALVGIMMIVAVYTFEWSSLRIFNKMPRPDVWISVIVALVTIFFHNLALAVLIGVVLSALVFSWYNTQILKIEKTIENTNTHYYLKGPLFYGTSQHLLDTILPHEDEHITYLHMDNSYISDLTALDTLKIATLKYKEQGKQLIIAGLAPHDRLLIKKAHKLLDLHIQGNQK